MPMVVPWLSSRSSVIVRSEPARYYRAIQAIQQSLSHGHAQVDDLRSASSAEPQNIGRSTAVRMPGVGERGPRRRASRYRRCGAGC